jgi:NADPH:quinone reductase-like Zn-dependent oxidoreductase
MKAAVRHSFGSPDVIEIEEVDRPTLEDEDVLVRVKASSVNKADWYDLKGKPWVGRFAMGLTGPKMPRFGTDYAGTVEAVGDAVTDFEPGDEVYGGRTGAYAEYVVVKNAIAPKPANLSFAEAAAIPIAGLTALQGLRDMGVLQPGQHVLINGASGGVGTFAVQIAKALGAEVTAVCSPGNVDQSRALGADHVVDYTREDFTDGERRYHLVLDVAGSQPWSKLKRVLEPEGIDVIVGAPSRGSLLGPLGFIAKTKLGGVLGSQKVVFFIAKFNRPDLHVLTEMIESGSVKPAIDRRYELDQIGDAFRYFGEGHARAKVVVTM